MAVCLVPFTGTNFGEFHPPMRKFLDHASAFWNLRQFVDVTLDELTLAALVFNQDLCLENMRRTVVSRELESRPRKLSLQQSHKVRPFGLDLDPQVFESLRPFDLDLPGVQLAFVFFSEGQCVGKGFLVGRRVPAWRFAGGVEFGLELFDTFGELLVKTRGFGQGCLSECVGVGRLF